VNTFFRSKVFAFTLLYEIHLVFVGRFIFHFRWFGYFLKAYLDVGLNKVLDCKSMRSFADTQLLFNPRSSLGVVVSEACLIFHLNDTKRGIDYHAVVTYT
jgi:hypothetical protein